jgi:antiviral helicase SKI2
LHLDPVDGTVTVKGRAGCEVAAGDTLALTEALFAGCFAGLGSADAAALLCAFVFQESLPPPAAWPTPALARAVEAVTRTLTSAGEAQAAAGVPGCGDPAEWVASVFKPGLAPAVHAWAAGAPFADVCRLTDVPEGSIVRCVTRTDEAARELRDAARAVGDTGLWAAMDAVSGAIRRDVVFAASLYVA